MSNYVPFEIQVEIIKRLPVKSLIQFRSVSKTWKSLIDSSDFVARYSSRHTQIQHVLLGFYTDFERKYVSVLDDDTFPQQELPLTVPLSVNWLRYYKVIGCSHGLFCLYGDYRKGHGFGFGTATIVLWNPTIRKVVSFGVPNVANGLFANVLGFGVCPETADPKIVKITQIKEWDNVERITCIPWHVEIFTLSTGAWRSPYNNSNLPRKSIDFVDYLQVVSRGLLFWLAIDRITMDDISRYYNLIISFDLTSEEFREVNLPYNLAYKCNCNLSISKLMDSLVVLERGEDAANEPVCAVWMMEDGVHEVFTKLLMVNLNSLDATVKAFRKSGEAIVAITEEDDHGLLVAYKPYSKDVHTLGIDRMEFPFIVYPYEETLLLLDQPNLIGF